MNGGAGLAFDLTGEMRTYGSGGGGGTHTASPGGRGGTGAGNGADGGNHIAATKGVDGLGGGGGGGNNDQNAKKEGADGGSGTVILAFTVGDHSTDATRFAVAAVAEQILVGETVEPEPVVTNLAGEVLAKGTHYTLAYANNDAPGVGTVTAVGAEGTPYEGFSASASFTITAAPIRNDFIAVTDAAADIRVYGTRVICVLTNVNAAAIHVVTRRQLTLEEYLVVGGGGAGGCNIGGGGGGGGVVHAAPRTVVGAGTDFAATVGKGGLAPSSGKGAGGQGGHSSLAFGSISTNAWGGNGGSSWDNVNYHQSWHDDGAVGSGGGLCYYSSKNEEGKTWNPAQGNSGGPKDGASGGHAGGGGGGAGKKSTNVNGGEGLAFDLTGEMRTYGSGGGGGTHNTSPGGFGGAGAGDGADGKAGTYATKGTDGLGGGGGGGSNTSTGGRTKSANGGSGTVILVFTAGDHAADATRFTVDPIEDQMVVDDAATPTLVVRGEDGEPLTEGVDYTVDYADNDRTGVAKAIAIGAAGTSYEGFSAFAIFNVYGAELRTAELGLSDTSAVFSTNGSLIVCDVTNSNVAVVQMVALVNLTLESCEVTGGGGSPVVDRTVTLVPPGGQIRASVGKKGVQSSAQVGAGQSVVSPGGSGTATGYVRLVFSVGDHAAPGRRFALEGDIPSQIYNPDAASEPEFVVRAGDGRVLTKDVDYTVEYADNDRIGTAGVLVSGCAGTDFAGFSIRTTFAIGTAYHVTGMALDEEGSGMSWDSPMSLGAAIADAPDGSIILVKAGEYTVPATIAIAKPLDIRGGLAGTDDTTLAADPVTVLDAALDTAVPVLCKVSTTAQGAQNRFSRIVFRNATLRGIGKTGAADLLLEDCAILTNGTVGVDSQANSYGKALRVESASGANVTLRNCLVQGNRATVKNCYSGGALHLSGCQRVVLENCDFIGNGVQLRYGGGGGGDTRNLYWFSGSAILSSAPIEATGCRFLQNFATQCHSDGGCVRLNSGAKGSVFRNCIWAGNSGVQGYGNGYEMPAGALLVALGSRTDSITVENCTFAYNVNDCGQTSAGLTVHTGTVNAKNCVFFGNQLGGGASYKAADVLARENGVCNLSYSLLSADAKTSYDHATGGEVSLGAGVVFGDPLFVTPLADVDARRSGGVYTVNDAAVGFLNALDVHLRSSAGTTLNDGTERTFEDELSPALDIGDTGSEWRLEPEPNGGRINAGAYGNTPEASKTPKGQVGIDGEVEVAFPFADSRPRVTFTVGGEGDFNADVVISFSTNGTDWCWVSEKISNKHLGDVVVFDAPICLVPGGDLVVRVDISGKGTPVAKDSAPTPVGGTLPIWYGHGGDSETVLHVRAGAYGKGDGTSWADAVTDFEAATRCLTSAHREMWIASNLTMSAKAVTFSPSAAFAIRGGFDGHEDAATDRAEGAVTTLDGADTWDILSLSNAQEARVERIRFYRAKNFAFVKSGAGDLTVESCLFVTNGNTSSVADLGKAGGKGLRVTGSSGATVTVRNSLFYENRTMTSGGMAGGALEASGCHRLVVEDCDFVGNGAPWGGLGGGNSGDKRTYWFDGAAILASVPVAATRCRFSRNVANLTYSNGGIVKLNGGAGGSAFTNCLWVGNLDRYTFNNLPRDSAGPLVVNVGAGKTVAVERCTFAYNMSDQTAAAAGITLMSGAVDVRNSIFHGNMCGHGTSGCGTDLYLKSGTSATIAYTLFDEEGTNSVTCLAGGETNFLAGVIYGDPLFMTTLGDLAPYARNSGRSGYFDTSAACQAALEAANLHLRGRAGYLDEQTGRRVWSRGQGSPAVDAGDPGTDCSREPELGGVGTSGGRVNLGAYGNTPWATMTPVTGAFLRIR